MPKFDFGCETVVEHWLTVGVCQVHLDFVRWVSACPTVPFRSQCQSGCGLGETMAEQRGVSLSGAAAALGSGALGGPCLLGLLCGELRACLCLCLKLPLGSSSLHSMCCKHGAVSVVFDNTEKLNFICVSTAKHCGATHTIFVFCMGTCRGAAAVVARVHLWVEASQQTHSWLCRFHCAHSCVH